LFNLLELDVECGKFEIPFGNLVTKNHKKNTIIIQILKRRFANQFAKRKKKKKMYYFSIFFISKNEKTKSFKKNGIEEIAHFSKFSKRNFSKLPKTKKKVHDSALIIQERDFSHL
jgi:hypothetical protein